MPSPRAIGLSIGSLIFAQACAAEPARSPAAGLPAYGPEDATLLDDGLSGHLFDTAFVPGNAGDDPHFADRVSRAENIWLVKVATVSLNGSEGALGNNRSYGLSFRPLESLIGALPSEPISLNISGKDPSFHWLDRAQGSWVGHEVLLMVRRYRDGDRVVLHFHGEPNSTALRQQILEIRRAAPTRK
ncbi:MAG TPA: hypothetical protein VGM44_11915 [Polyangiaceae bacterium]